MKNLDLCFVGFSDSNYTAITRIIDLMSKKHDFEYKITQNPKGSDLIFFENSVPKDFPKKLEVPQLIISDGRTFCGCNENQHRITWGRLELEIGLLINVIKFFSK